MLCLCVCCVYVFGVFVCLNVCVHVWGVFAWYVCVCASVMCMMCLFVCLCGLCVFVYIFVL